MKKNLFLMMGAALALVFTACEKKNEPKADEVGTTYPRVQLIEHFTGDECGYCPAGMDYIYEEYSKDSDNIVWVSNHYGYNTDEYTIKGSSTIGKALSVDGAPAISINRYQYTNSAEGYSKAKSYHPYFTSAVLAKQATTATEMIEISRQYDAASKLLTVTITGKTSREDLEGVMLTVGVTESGMQGKQADYYNTWEGWQKFTHTHAIRVYASAAMGDDIFFTNRLFTQVYEIEMSDKWNADNCEIVAWITALDTKYPVLNAAKLPVVEGTKGGEDIKHGGVEAVAVSDTYPEPSNVTPKTAVNLGTAQCTIKAYTGYSVASIIASNDTINCGAYGSYGNLYPSVGLYIFLNEGATALPNGTYTVASYETAGPGNVVAGFRDDDARQVSGSIFYYLLNYSSKQYIIYQWMITSGTLTVTDGVASFEGAARNGKALSFSFTIQSTSAVPARVAPAPLAPVCEAGAPACRQY